MKKRTKVVASLLIILGSGTVTVWLNSLDFVPEIDIATKLIVVIFSFLLTICIYAAVWIGFVKTRQEALCDHLLPLMTCIHCDDLLCCLQAIRPHIWTDKGIQNILSLSRDDPQGNSSLTDEFDLATKEAHVKREVWIASPDLSYDCQDTNFTNVVRHNLNRKKIRYVFFALDNSASRQNAEKLFNKYKTLRNSRRIRFYLLNERQYKLTLHLYSIVIYDPNPNPQKDVISSAYVCVGENDMSVRSIYKSLNENSTNDAIGILRRIQEDGNLRYRPQWNR